MPAQKPVLAANQLRILHTGRVLQAGGAGQRESFTICQLRDRSLQQISLEYRIL